MKKGTGTNLLLTNNLKNEKLVTQISYQNWEKKIVLSSIENIQSADLSDAQLISKYNKGVG